MATIAGLTTAVKAETRVRLPQRPRRVDDLLVLPVGEQSLLLTGRVPTMLKGKSIVQVLPRLLPLLDGTRDLEALSHALPRANPETLSDLLTFLYVEGITEEGHASPTPSAYAAQEAFFSRHGSFTRSTANGQQTQQLLNTATVQLFGQGQIATLLADALRTAGIAQLRTATEQGADEAGLIESVSRDAGATGLVIAALDRFDSAYLSRLNRLCLAHNVRFLPIIVAPGGFSQVGPVAVPQKTACFECFVTGRTGEELARQSATGKPDAAYLPFARFAVQQAALETINILTHWYVPTIYDALLQGDAETWQFRTRPVLRLPRCPACGDAWADVPTDITVGMAHQENVIQLFHLASPNPTLAKSSIARSISATRKS